MKSTVVVGYDQTPHSERALILAAREAAWRGASLTVVHAFDWIPPTTPMTYIPGSVELAIQQTAEKIAEHGAAAARSLFPGMHVEAKTGPGGAAEALATAARGADLLVVGNRGRGGFAGLLLGSVSMRALTASCVPTMVVRGPHRDPHDAVLVAVDLDDPADDLLDFAFNEAARRGARLEAVTVWDMSWVTEYADEAAEIQSAAAQARVDLDAALEAVVHTWHGKYSDVRVSHRVAEGNPAAELIAATSHADLIVAGARRHGDGRHGMRIGPVAHALVQHADCPVVIVPRD
ncbi:nucleotide-binding universal stress UspA family protein [Catenulispora sp. GP43]|uniref:universal stress protein n=1 Tax=Catenulispora sp. GP43 TaxID=3156263 RepID=UPI00351336C8